jgi:tRNA pseudouridine55 synthase
VSKRSDSGLDGILLIDKPAGWTSHDVVAKARRVTGQRRIGHTGTLDPMATGLLVLCLGRATRLVEYLIGHDKRYTGVIALGRTTATDDSEGETIHEAAVPDLTEAELDAAVAGFRGAILQRPPAYSALKVQGKRAYDLARAGRVVELAEREVTVRQFQATFAAPGTVQIDVTCSSGTYIRSLARDLGEGLGCGGHLAALRREAAGPFDVREAVTLATVERAVGAGRLDEFLLQPDDGILDLGAALLGVEGATALSNGVPWQVSNDGNAFDPLRIYSFDGAFVGVGSMSDSGEIRASKVFVRLNSAF